RGGASSATTSSTVTCGGSASCRHPASKARAATAAACSLIETGSRPRGPKVVAWSADDVSAPSPRASADLSEEVGDVLREAGQRGVLGDAIARSEPALAGGRDDQNLTFLGQHEPDDLDAGREVPVRLLAYDGFGLVLAGHLDGQDRRQMPELPAIASQL